MIPTVLLHVICTVSMVFPDLNLFLSFAGSGPRFVKVPSILRKPTDFAYIRRYIHEFNIKIVNECQRYIQNNRCRKVRQYKIKTTIDSSFAFTLPPQCENFLKPEYCRIACVFLKKSIPPNFGFPDTARNIPNFHQWLH